MIDPPRDVPTVQFFRRRIPVGDFKPWMRLIIMLAMLLAVSTAAKSLSKRLQNAKIEERLESFLAADERVTLQFRSLVPTTSFPLATAESLNLTKTPRSIWREIVGFAVDAAGRPVAGARASACGKLAMTGADGRFRIENVPVRGTVNLTILPPENRPELGFVTIDDVGPGLPEHATPVGIIILPARSDSSAPVLTKIEDATKDNSKFIFEAGADAADGLSLDGWNWVYGENATKKPGARRRELLFTKEGAVLRADDLESKDSMEPGSDGVRGTLQFAEELPESALIAIDLYSSGIWSAAAAIVPKKPAGGGLLKYDFDWNHLPRGDHRLIALAPGFAPSAVDFTIPLPERDASVNITMEPAAEITVRVERAGASIPPGVALAISGPNLQKAHIALGEDGVIRLTSLPAKTLKFELLVSRTGAAREHYTCPPLERLGEPIIRTLQAGPKNLNITFHHPKDAPPPLKAVGGVTKPSATVYRSGARFDEPFTFAKADRNGKFTIWAAEGERIVQAMGNAPYLLPFASGVVAGNTVTADAPATLQIHGAPGADIEWTLTGPFALGRIQILQIADESGAATLRDLPPDVPFLLRCSSDNTNVEIPGTTPAAGETLKITVDPRVKS